MSNLLDILTIVNQFYIYKCLPFYVSLATYVPLCECKVPLRTHSLPLPLHV